MKLISHIRGIYTPENQYSMLTQTEQLQDKLVKLLGREVHMHNRHSTVNLCHLERVLSSTALVS
jgi:hypothetical protein